MATAADVTHPTGMHSCFAFMFENLRQCSISATPNFFLFFKLYCATYEKYANDNLSLFMSYSFVGGRRVERDALLLTVHPNGGDPSS